MITFLPVDPEYGAQAYAAHAEFAEANEAVLPRTRERFLELVDQGLCWAATDDSGLIGLAYAALDEKVGEWEIGGLMVLERARGKGIGGILMSLALGHMLIFEDPLTNMPGIPIVAHVLKQNPMPRGIISKLLKFHHSRDLKIPGSALPGLPVEADGKIHGDEFSISLPETLIALADFCENWSDTLPNGERARIEVLEGLPLSIWAQAFREMAERNPS